MNHLRSVGGKVSLPHELSKIIHPEAKTKDNGFNLLSAFQGLSFGTATLTGRKHSKPSTLTPAWGDSCKVMWSICDHKDDWHAAFWLCYLLKKKKKLQGNSRRNTFIHDCCSYTNMCFNMSHQHKNSGPIIPVARVTLSNVKVEK